MKNIQILTLLFLILFYSCSSSDTDDMVTNPTDSNTGMITPEEEEEMETQILMGDFMDDAHPTSGVAKVDVATQKLLFENFKTDDGPALLVYLATDIVATEFVNLEGLQGIEGDFEYSIPNNVDYGTYKYVLIWCVDFSVNFGYAELQ